MPANRLVDKFIPFQVRRKAILSVQNPVRLGRYSELHPDIALFVPREDFYAEAHSGPVDVLLLVEVAESSAECDCEVKVPLYARFGIREVWLVDLESGHVEVYRTPSPRGCKEETIQRRGGSLRPMALPESKIRVEKILVPQD